MPPAALKISPRNEARIAGAIYVLVIVLGAYAELVGRQGLVIAGSPIATLHAIAVHQSQYRLGFLAEMLTNVLAIPVTIIFVWRLLRPVNPTLALIALVFDLTQNTINAVNAWTQFAPLGFLSGSPDVSALSLSEKAALARLALHWHDSGFQIGLTFFGFALLLEGWLVFRSGYFPRWLGILYALAGGCYLVSACDYFMALRMTVIPYVQLGSFVGEAVMALWLLLVGLNAAKWRSAEVCLDHETENKPSAASQAA
ncbi:MAG TPA: DUF4386 domain-containing protein [Rhizomicrobium sp.]|jgi:hypothetical protein